MRFVVRAFRCVRPVWFRPSAIAVGFVVGQLFEQRVRHGEPPRLASPFVGVTLLEGMLIVAAAGAVGLLAYVEWDERQRVKERAKLDAIVANHVPRTVSVFCDPTATQFDDHASCDGYINKGFGLRRPCECRCHR